MIKKYNIKLELIIFFICFLLYIVLAFLLINRHQGIGGGTRGDEPHYLVIVESILKDKDLDLKNNYENKDYLSFYNSNQLNPQVIKSNNGRWYPTHGIGLAIIILPIWLFTRSVLMVRIYIGFLSALFITIIFSLNYVVLKNKKLSLLVALVLGLSLPIFSCSILIFPDIPAGLIITYTVKKILMLNKKSNPFIIGLLISFLPWLQSRFIPISFILIFCFSLIFYKKSFKSHFFLFWIPVLISCGLFLLYYRSLFGNFSPMVIYKNAFSIKNVFPGFINGLLNINKGLLVNTPIYLLSILGLIIGLKDKQKKLKRFIYLTLMLITSYLAVIYLYDDWGGGWSPAARYFVPIIGLLGVYLLLALDYLISTKKIYVFYLLSVLSIIISFTIPFTPSFGYSIDNNQPGINIVNSMTNESLQIIRKLIHNFF